MSVDLQIEVLYPKFLMLIYFLSLKHNYFYLVHPTFFSIDLFPVFFFQSLFVV